MLSILSTPIAIGHSIFSIIISLSQSSSNMQLLTLFFISALWVLQKASGSGALMKLRKLLGFKQRVSYFVKNSHRSVNTSFAFSNCPLPLAYDSPSFVVFFFPFCSSIEAAIEMAFLFISSFRTAERKEDMVLSLPDFVTIFERSFLKYSYISFRLEKSSPSSIIALNLSQSRLILTFRRKLLSLKSYVFSIHPKSMCGSVICLRLGLISCPTTKLNSSKGCLYTFPRNSGCFWEYETIFAVKVETIFINWLWKVVLLPACQYCSQCFSTYCCNQGGRIRQCSSMMQAAQTVAVSLAIFLTQICLMSLKLQPQQKAEQSKQMECTMVRMSSL